MFFPPRPGPSEALRVNAVCAQQLRGRGIRHMRHPRSSEGFTQDCKIAVSFRLHASGERECVSARSLGNSSECRVCAQLRGRGIRHMRHPRSSEGFTQDCKIAVSFRLHASGERECVSALGRSAPSRKCRPSVLQSLDCDIIRNRKRDGTHEGDSQGVALSQMDKHNPQGEAGHNSRLTRVSVYTAHVCVM